MIYRERSPHPALRPWIRSLWYCCTPAIAHKHERVLPNGCMQIVVSLSRDHLTNCQEGSSNRQLSPAILVGARQRYGLIDTADLKELVGAVIEPGGFPGLFRDRADLVFEQSISLTSLWPNFSSDRVREAATFARKLDAFEAVLQDRLVPSPKRSSLIEGALCFLNGPNATVRACAASAGIGERRLSQVFREQVGLSPKTWFRIQRFQTAVKALHRGAEVEWVELALHAGYYDQSHFINDFRAFSGLNPTTYCNSRGRWQNHVAVT